MNNATTAKAILQTAAAVQEQLIENEIRQYDCLLEDDDAIGKLRQRRLQEMKQQEQNRQLHLQNGHGHYTDISAGSNDIAKEFFSITKQSENVVVHFYKSSSAHICDALHKHLSILATKCLETRFIKINVEPCLNDSSIGTTTNNGITYLVEKLHVSIMPTVVLIKNRQVVHKIQGYDELGGTTSFTTRSLLNILRSHNVINKNSKDDDFDDDDETTEKFSSSKQRSSGINSVRLVNQRANKYDRRSLYDDADDDE